MTGTLDKGLVPTGQFLPDFGTLRRTVVPKSKKQQRTIQDNSIREPLIGNENYTAVFVGTRLEGQLRNDYLIKKFWKDTSSYPIRRLVI